MHEIDLSNQAKTVVDAYKAAFLERYNTPPIMPTMEFSFALTTFKDLIREVGLGRTVAMVTHYLKMNGDKDWFKSNGHSVAVFQKNIHAINAATPSPGREQGAMRITFESHCPTVLKWTDGKASAWCPNPVTITCMTDEMEALACSKPCPTCSKDFDEMESGLAKLNRFLDAMPPERRTLD